MILSFDSAWPDANAIPSDWEPGSIGPRASVVAALAQVFAGATEDEEGTFQTSDDWTEIWVGTEDPVESINVTLRSGSDSATIGRVVEFAALLGTRALDTQTGEFLTAEGGAASYDKWDRWLSRVVGEGGEDETPESG
jgi:hypothetical protein